MCYHLHASLPLIFTRSTLFSTPRTPPLSATNAPSAEQASPLAAGAQNTAIPTPHQPAPIIPIVSKAIRTTGNIDKPPQEATEAGPTQAPLDTPDGGPTSSQLSQQILPSTSRPRKVRRATIGKVDNPK